MICIWNIAILVVGIGFFYQDQPWATYFIGPGYTALIVLWLYFQGQAVHLRWVNRSEAEATPDSTH